MHSIFCTVCKIWQKLHFVKFCGNSPQKGGLVHQKGGRSQMFDTEKSLPSFPLVSVGKILRKYRLIPNRNTKLSCNSKYYACLLYPSTHQPPHIGSWQMAHPSCDLLHFCCFVLLYYGAIVSLCYCTIVPSYHCAIVPLFHQAIVPSCYLVSLYYHVFVTIIIPSCAILPSCVMVHLCHQTIVPSYHQAIRPLSSHHQAIVVSCHHTIACHGNIVPSCLCTIVPSLRLAIHSTTCDPCRAAM